MIAPGSTVAIVTGCRIVRGVVRAYAIERGCAGVLVDVAAAWRWWFVAFEDFEDDAVSVEAARAA